MYDNIIKSIDLSSDEVDLLKELLFYKLETCVSVGEEIIVRDLLEKLDSGIYE